MGLFVVEFQIALDVLQRPVVAWANANSGGLPVGVLSFDVPGASTEYPTPCFCVTQ